MASITLTKNIDATPEEVWPYLADARRWPEWMPGLSSSVVTNGKPEGVGRRQRLEIEFGGRRGQVELEITEWQPQARIAWVHLSDRIEGVDKQFARDIHTRITMSPAAGGTAMSFEGSWEPVGLMGKMLSGTLVKSRASTIFEGAAQNLERVAQRRPGG